MGFALKKLAGALLMPLPLLTALALAGWWLARRGRRRVGRALVGGAAALLWAASCAPLVRWAVADLEDAYPAFPGDSVAAVVVLSGGHVSDPALPITAWPDAQTLYRVAEGVRIAVAQPWAEVVLSGFGGPDPRSQAEVNRDLAVALGVAPERIVTEPWPRDTAGEARLLKPLLRGRRFALVTSATHMPRAVALFRARGLDPIPAPTGHLARGRAWEWADLLPSEDALVTARQLWYEALGRSWVRLLAALGAAG